jgi:hypothetical protein
MIDSNDSLSLIGTSCDQKRSGRFVPADNVRTFRYNSLTWSDQRIPLWLLTDGSEYVTDYLDGEESMRVYEVALLLETGKPSNFLGLIRDNNKLTDDMKHWPIISTHLQNLPQTTSFCAGQTPHTGEVLRLLLAWGCKRNGPARGLYTGTSTWTSTSPPTHSRMHACLMPPIPRSRR